MATRRRTVGAAVVVLTLGSVAACGPVNAGSAFEAQFTPFLVEREGLADFEVTSQNTLPWSGEATVTIDLRPDLTPRQMVEEVWAVMHHDVDDFVGYDLVARFPARSGDGAESVAAAPFDVGRPAPDETAVRELVAERIERGRDIVALGSGPTIWEPSPALTRLSTGADALEVWRELCAAPDLLSEVRRLEVRTGPVDLAEQEPRDVSRDSARVESPAEEGCAGLEDIGEVLEAVTTETTVVHYDAQVSVAATEREPTLSIEPEAGGGSLTAARTRATDLGVVLTIEETASAEDG